MKAFLKRLFAPRGNLLTTDILAEVQVHLLSSGEAKTQISKFQDTPEQQVAQALVQALISGAVGLAKERRISIHWAAVAAMHPPFPEHANLQQGAQRG